MVHDATVDHRRGFHRLVCSQVAPFQDPNADHNAGDRDRRKTGTLRLGDIGQRSRAEFHRNRLLHVGEKNRWVVNVGNLRIPANNVGRHFERVPKGRRWGET